jgi:dihydrofolate reductase
MALSVQLPSEEQQMLEVAAKRMGRNTHDLLRQAVRELYQRLVITTDSRTPYELGQDLFGAGNLAVAPSDPLKRQIWEKLCVKHRRLG